MKNILIMSKSSPFHNMHTRDALDMALIFAAVDQNISWLLSGSAVLNLKAQQSTESLGMKDFFKNIKTLEIYDVENIYVCEKSLFDYGLSTDDLIIQASSLNFQQQQQLIQRQQYVVTL
ncbi:sulfurtransferase complex subunit TusC [Pseudoalteromonas sp. MMG010]|uniref:sulfurtransferase complex subunit TusC n=1 Tax=Pseudoalteromonas sp. MMG010 TaxID=2822685 RepID=UPI001B39F2E4|nr:sulfurtransferase complex subunit TusC [Pseudoalteromonas sp. MMG010]MBQ4832473.1 sulfurtransferase complex subunit TusC [Pseudoalteromonas sp. MMG010]